MAYLPPPIMPHAGTKITSQNIRSLATKLYHRRRVLQHRFEISLHTGSPFPLHSLSRGFQNWLAYMSGFASEEGILATSANSSNKVCHWGIFEVTSGLRAPGWAERWWKVPQHMGYLWGSLKRSALRAQCTRSATIWASGRTRDPYFEILGAPRGIMVTPSGGFDF